MIQQENELKVRSSGIGSTEFGICLNRKMFAILSSGLYSDRIKAVIRELCTNAADSHVAAGKSDTPFTVHLPSYSEPTFEVTDYGTGLSPDDMVKVYTQYGASTKTNTNDQTGCLGLGSKSPFAYTDSFTIASRYNGIESTYTAYLAENGRPALSEPMTQLPTDKGNGLTVKFSVKKEDFSAFVTKSIEVLQWFKPRPKVTGNSSFYYPPATEYMFDTDKYAIPKVHTGRSYCVMGNVAYPLDRYSLGANSQCNAMLDYGIILKVGIGDVDMTASRESLVYSSENGVANKTVPFIKQRLVEAIADMEKEVTKSISTATDIWEARKQLAEVQNRFPSFNFKGMWQGKELSLWIPSPVGTEYWKRQYSSRGLKLKESVVDKIGQDTPIILLDCKNHKQLIRYYFEQKNIDKAYILDFDTPETWLQDEELTKRVVRTSTMEKRPRGEVNRSTAAKAKVYLWTRYASTASDCWEPAEIDMEDDDEFVYVEIKFFRILKGENVESQHPQEIDSLMKNLAVLNGSKVKLYGIRPTDTKLIEKSAGTWITFSDYLKEVQEKQATKFATEIAAKNKLDGLGHCGVYSRFSQLKFDPASTISKYFAEVTKAKSAVKPSNEFAAFRYLCDYLGVPTGKLDESLSKLQREVVTKYPLLSHLNDYYRDDAAKKLFNSEVCEYVKMVENR